MADDSAGISPAQKGDDPAQGLQLVKAFMKIRDPIIRDALVVFVERMAGSTVGQLDNP